MPLSPTCFGSDKLARSYEETGSLYRGVWLYRPTLPGDMDVSRAIGPRPTASLGSLINEPYLQRPELYQINGDNLILKQIGLLNENLKKKKNSR